MFFCCHYYGDIDISTKKNGQACLATVRKVSNFSKINNDYTK
jgi:hypothetical protein